jgi:hypothetical protein
MSHNSTQLQLTLQDLDDNPDTWGDILNTSTIELLEDAVAGMSTATLISSSDFPLDTTAGGDATAHYRKMIIFVTGTPGDPTNVLAPDDTSLGVSATGLYLVYDNTTGGDAITFKTVNGTGIVLKAGEATWCYCDGTDIIGARAATAGNSDTTTLATDSSALGGIPAASYAALGVHQEFTAGQSTPRVTLTDTGNNITPDLALSNTFYALWDGNYTLKDPLNPSDGATFSLVIEQDTGAPFTIAYEVGKFIFPNAVAPVLSIGDGDVDFLAFERVTLSTGAIWLCTAVKNWG